MSIFEEFGLPSGWVVDVWNCHGVLKLEKDGGYGSLVELPKGMEWLAIGQFSIPIKSDQKQYYTEKLCRKISGFLERILARRGGAINISGIYPIWAEEFDEYITILAKHSPPQTQQVSLENLFYPT
jgi:hypothetical protein